MRCRAGWKTPTRCCAAASAFDGESVDVKDGVSVFDLPPPSPGWQEALHGFAWLPPLAAAGGEAARTLATNLIAQWIKRNARYSEPAWSPHVMARRLMHIFSHGRLVIANSDMLWRSKLFVSLREQARMLERIAARGARRPAAAGSGRGAGAVRRLPGRQPATAGDRAGAAGSRNRAPDPARWRPCQPFAGRPAARLSLSDHGDGRADARRTWSRRMRCATPMTAWRRCCASSAMATARWRCSRRAGRRSAHDRRPSGARRSARPAFRACPPFRLSAPGGGTQL